MRGGPVGRMEPVSPGLGEAQRKALLDAARSALRLRLAGEGERSGAEEAGASALPYPEHHGVFVSLRTDGELRGCIGTLDPRMPLLRAVEGCAVSAASDTRFPPLSAAELPRTRIEISVLGACTRIRSESEVTIGRDGLKVSLGSCRGLLLPQVAPQQRWDARRFLEETCVKAGLPRDSWRHPETVLEVFTAEIFCEPEPARAPGSAATEAPRGRPG